MSNLIKEVLGSVNYTEDYLEGGFLERYTLIEKIMKGLSKEEQKLFCQYMNEESDDLYKIIKYFTKRN